MKQSISLFLVLVLILSVVMLMSSCTKTNEVSSDAEDTAITDDTDNTNRKEDTDTPNTSSDPSGATAPGSSVYVSRKAVKTDGEPEYTDGRLFIRFAEAVPEKQTVDCTIGLCQRYSAETISASFDFDAMEEYKTEDGYSAAVIIPGSEIAPGTYEFYVSFGTIIVKTFSLDVQ